MNVLYLVVHVLGGERSVRLEKIFLDGPKLAALQTYLYSRTWASSAIQCAAQCLAAKYCLSVIRDTLLETCSIYTIGVNHIYSTNTPGSVTIYRKRGKKNESEFFRKEKRDELYCILLIVFHPSRE